MQFYHANYKVEQNVYNVKDNAEIYESRTKEIRDIHTVETNPAIWNRHTTFCLFLCLQVRAYPSLASRVSDVLV